MRDNYLKSIFKIRDVQRSSLQVDILKVRGQPKINMANSGALMVWLLLEWILQNMVRHFVTHKQVQVDKRRPI